LWWLKLDAMCRLPAPASVEPITDIAAGYVAELLDAAPNGRLALVGFSWSGLIAFEVARRLRDAGRSIQVALLEPDIPGPQGSYTAGYHQLQWSVRRPRSGLRKLGVWHYLRTEATALCYHIREQLRQGYIGVRRALTGDIPLSYGRWRYYQPQVIDRIRSHVQLPCAGPVHLVGRPEWLDTYGLYWPERVDGELVRCESPLARTHHDLTRLPFAMPWVELVLRWSRAPDAAETIVPVSAQCLRAAA
jgi:pimeloyl-ACP methyl ester carboxylesterase